MASRNWHQPPEGPSDDLAAIKRDVASQDRTELIWKRSMARDADLAEAMRLQEEIDFLAGILALESRPKQPGAWFRAKRILVRRFGRLGAGHIIRLLAPVVPDGLRLILRERTNKELEDGGKNRRRVEREWDDFLLAQEVLRNRENGMGHDEAIWAAMETLARTSRGFEGAKKAMTRFRRRAKERGYVEPYVAVTARLLAVPLEEPEFKVADLPGPGRPKIPTMPD